MTKTMLNKWLEQKQKQAEREACKQFEEEKDAYLARLDETLGVNEALESAYNYFFAANRVVNDFRNKLYEKPDVTVNSGWYDTVSRMLNELTDKDTLRRMIRNEFSDTSGFMMKLEIQKNETIYEIRKNYAILSANVSSMKNAKSGVEYLQKLGFDLTDLLAMDEKPVTQALTTKVNTNYLFVGGMKK